MPACPTDVASAADDLEVTPVVDYEPPAFGGTPKPPRGEASRPHRPPSSTPRPPRGPDIRAAVMFTDTALRRILEVIDRRRPPAHVRPLLAPGLADSLLASTGRHAGQGTARLCRLRAQPVGTRGTIAEVAASYTRANRVHAMACRVEQVTTANGPRWQVVALHLG